MKTTSALAAAALALPLAWPANAATGTRPAIPAGQAPRYAEIVGDTLPPAGFVAFCSHHREACTRTNEGSARAHMSAERWRAVYRVNHYVNASILPASDEALYGEPERWTYPTVAGDCEDYALLKQRFLESIGLPRSALLMTVVLDEKNEGHAVLTLATDEGDYVLDNRNDRIRRWPDHDYTFLKRQSQDDPRKWVSLIADPPLGVKAVAARAAE